MSEVIEIKTGYAPKVEPLKDLKLPIELRNGRGDVIATIFYLDYDKCYHWSVNNKSSSYGFSEFSDCLESAFAYLYTEMQEFRKEAEEYRVLKGALRTALKTPWNNL